MGLYASSDRIKELWAAMKSRFIGVENVGGYWGMIPPDSAGNGFLRTPVNGLIPYKQGVACSLGTPSWPFRWIHAVDIFERNVRLSDKYAPFSHGHLPTSITNNGLGSTSELVPPIYQGLIDAAGACRSAFMPPDGVRVEYSTDAGATWAEYPLSDSKKRGITSAQPSTYLQLGGVSSVPSADNALRITLIPVDRYASVNLFYCWFVSNGASDNKVTIECSTVGEKEAFIPLRTDVTVGGWPGSNVVELPGRTFGGNSSQPANAYSYRFTFRSGVAGTVAVPTVADIRLYGANGWALPNNMTKHGHLYDWDYLQRAIFPAAVTAPEFVESGATLSSKYAAINHAHSPMVGSSASASGTAGIVPAPPAGAATRYLRCDGAWAAPPAGGGIDYRPKDSVYLTKGAESPAALFGGTWTQRSDTFLFSGYKIWERVG